jgi:hypothetical protein
MCNSVYAPYIIQLPDITPLGGLNLRNAWCVIYATLVFLILQPVYK